MRAVVAAAAACHLCTLFISPAHRVALFYSFILFLLFSSFTTILYIFFSLREEPRLYYNNCDSADPAPRLFSFSARRPCTLFIFFVCRTTWANLLCVALYTLYSLAFAPRRPVGYLKDVPLLAALVGPGKYVRLFRVYRIAGWWVFVLY